MHQNIKINDGYPSHCSAKCLAADPEVAKHKVESYERRYGEGIVNPFQVKEVIDKIDETNLLRYGKRRYTQTDEFKSYITENSNSITRKQRETHIKYNSFNESRPEQLAYIQLKKKYPDLMRQYTSDVYPFTCDFYSPGNDLYIEYNGTWTHGGHPFDKDNQEDIKRLDHWRECAVKCKNDKSFYTNAIYTWTDLDVRKRKCAEENHLNYLVLWNLHEVYAHVIPNYDDVLNVKTLILPYRRHVFDDEFKFYRDADCSILNPYVSTKNEIVKYFQQDGFFSRERDIWEHDPEARSKLIENRVKYLKKTIEQLTHNDILNGFKRSGIYYGYSHFNPLWFKWFIQHYNVKSCYDPTGGWGHRLLGGLDLEKYIYNDLSPLTKAGVDHIIKFLHIKNSVTYCNDARTFIPTENFDSMFTCPPYYNVEVYECGGFVTIDDYNSFINNLFDIFHGKDTCRIFGLVMREDLLVGHQDYKEHFEVNVAGGNRYLNGGTNHNKEYMYIYSKN